jgi:hypothetical protein
MFLEDLNQNIEFLGFQRVDNALNHWRHVDLDIEIIGNYVGQPAFMDSNIQTKSIQIWEDIWLARKTQVIQFLSGLTTSLKSVFARDTRIVPISADAARSFLDANHLMGFSKGAFYLGCVVPLHRQFRGIMSEYAWEGNPLIAVAVFGKPMIMKEEGMEGDLSGELIKMATLPKIRLVGGITKFLEAYRLLQPVHNMMTYIDLDWNSGKGFLGVGFKVVAQTPPLLFKLVAGKRVSVTEPAEANVWTKGNLKLRYTYVN